MLNDSTDNHDSIVRTASWRRRLVALLGLALAFSAVGGFARFKHSLTASSQLKPFEMKGSWIKAPGPAARSAYFRKTLMLPGNVKNAWLVISSCDSYEVSVNRNPLGRLYLWRPTRPFHNGISEKGQRLTSVLPSMALNFPREYQWDGHDSFRVPQVIDLTSSMRPGRNVICIDIESRRAPAKACFNGEVELWSGLRIPISSGEDWASEPVPPGIQRHDWTELDYRATNWRHAARADAPDGALWKTFDHSIFQHAFQGRWLRHPTARATDSVWFEQSIFVNGEPDEAWIRVATNRSFVLFVNGTRVGVPSPHPPDLDSGHWVLGRQKALDPAATPELLDPDEIGSIYVGNRFESPRHADPVLDQFTPLENIQNRVRDKPRATNRADMPGTYDPKRTLAETRRLPKTPEGYPDPLTPKSLTRNRSQGGFLGYNIAPLLSAGENRIQIHLCAPLTIVSKNWAPHVAVDGGIRTRSNRQIKIESVDGWSCQIGTGLGNGSSMAPIATSEAMNRASTFPRLQYRGIALRPISQRTAWPLFMLSTAIATASCIAVVLLAAYSVRFQRIRNIARLQDRIGSPSNRLRANELMSNRLLNSATQILFNLLLGPTVVVFVALILESCYSERHEMMMFMQPSTWEMVFGIALLVSILTGAVEVLGRIGLTRLRRIGHDKADLMCRLPQTRFWQFGIFAILVGCGILRAYQLEFQPLDDDEYTSTQAVLAIIKTGIPMFVPESVWYTRSPLFHYVTAAIAWVFGANLWSLRLQTVAWGVATSWLTYLCGSRLFRSPWVGFGALVLISLHPFQIFTGHIIRFYQMQQFFALLTVYLFCKGFVEGQSQFYRYMTVLSFLCAVLSQEISAVIGVPLAIGYLIFSKDLGWKLNIKLAMVSIVALVIIILDFAVFQTRCLTRVEGVSPNLESTVKPHFWVPLNFLAIYIGYSRLHLLPSLFLLIGLPLAWRQRNRNTIAFHFMLVVGVALTNILVTGVSLRYQYWLIPIWLLLSVESIRLVVEWVCQLGHDPRKHKNRYMWAVGSSTAIILIGVVLSWSPWRIVGSYNTKLLGDSTGAMRYVRSQLRDTDRIAATEPHTHCGVIEAGRIDYDISIPLLYDYSMNDNGRLIDRNGGAEVVSNLDQLMEVCRTHDRVWILLNREKFRTRGKNMRWEYPGARFEMFIRKNCELKHRTYLWSVFLWDANRGFYVPFRQHGE